MQYLFPEFHRNFSSPEFNLASDMPNQKLSLQTGISDFNSAKESEIISNLAVLKILLYYLKKMLYTSKKTVDIIISYFCVNMVFCAFKLFMLKF